MNSWSFNILRQGGADLWMILCALAAGLAILRVLSEYRAARLVEPATLFAAVAASLGTLLVILIPPLHTPTTGLFWTLACLLVASFVLYRGIIRQIGTRRGYILLTLRFAVVALLVLMLFEPILRYSVTRMPQRPLHLIVDASGSMSVPDIPNGPTRLQSVWETIRTELPNLRQHFDVQISAFTTDIRKLDRAEDLPAIAPAGESTDIARALTTTLDQSPRADSAIILISDGIDNTSPDLLAQIGQIHRPIHTLAVGSEQTQSSAVQNIAVESVDADGDISVGHQTHLTATIRSSGLADRVVDVQYAQLASDGKPLAPPRSQKLILEPRPEGQKIQLPFTPAALGLQRVAVWVNPLPGERTAADNRQEYQGLAVDPRIKVLYIEGRARPEYRELKRALDRDANIELATFLRVQNERFSAAGSVDGEKISALPDTAAAWRKFDVIILGDLDARFLSGSQQSAVEQAVSEGSGLIMLGGQSSFGSGSYANTPIEKVLPVFVGDRNAPQEQSEFIPRLTSDGEMHPAMEGLAEWFGTETTPPSRKLLPMRGNIVVQRPRTGASVLLAHLDRPGPDGRPQIVLAVHRYGKGKAAAFTADTTYLWSLPLRGMGQESPYNRFWGQIVRWLADADVKNRQQGAGIDAMLNRSVHHLGQTVIVKAMVRDERGDATRSASVSAEIQKLDGDGNGQTQAASLTPAESRTGLYDLHLPHLSPGQWRIRISATKDKNTIGQQTLDFTILNPAEELLQLAAKPQLLAAISQKTQGWSYPLTQTPQLLQRLIASNPDHAPVQHVDLPLSNIARILPAILGRPPDWNQRYDLPMQGLIVAGLLVCEWLLRRRWQLS